MISFFHEVGGGGGVQRVHFKDINGFVIYSLSLSLSLYLQVDMVAVVEEIGCLAFTIYYYKLAIR